MNLLKHFKYDIPFTIICLVIAYFYGGLAVIPTVIMLAALEIVFSFDNAAVNSKYLVQMSPFWRKMFLTVGILIAVFGMRLIFPFAIVSVAGGVSLPEAFHLAFAKGDAHTPGTFGYILHHAHPLITPFAGIFLLMLALNYFLDTERDKPWLSWIEKPLIKAGHFDSLSILISLLTLAGITKWMSPEGREMGVLFSGILGLITYLAVNGLVAFMEAQQEAKEDALEHRNGTALLVGKQAFSLFLFLEVLDASFSFDGVLGAFAVTNDAIVIALGLGIGAMAVRSLTIFLVDEGALENYRYMEAGAHWAIGILAVLLLVTLAHPLPDWVVGLSGIVVIAASILSSHRANKRDAAELSDAHVPGLDPVGIHSSDL